MTRFGRNTRFTHTPATPSASSRGRGKAALHDTPNPKRRARHRYTRLGKNCVRWARIATKGAIKSNAIIPQVVGRAKFRL